MDSPIHIGDATTDSILRHLTETHLSAQCVGVVHQAVYSGHKLIQLSMSFRPTGKADSESIVLRRLQDSYVNSLQLLSILVTLGLFTPTQLEGLLRNEIIDSLQYRSSSNSVKYEDHSSHQNPLIRGIWIPYDRAVALARKFDIFEFTKPLFLVDVHDFDRLPKSETPPAEIQSSNAELDETTASSSEGSPTKKLRRLREGSELPVKIPSNPNHPFTLPPISTGSVDAEKEAEFKSRFGDIIRKSDTSDMPIDEIKSLLGPFSKSSPPTVADIALDHRGLTALHFALTLASANLVQVLLSEKLNSVFRGNADGECALILVINVTNLMQRGNFSQILNNWLHPQLWLNDNKKWSFLHHLVAGCSNTSRVEAAKFYFTKIFEFLAADPPRLERFITEIVNSQDHQHGNTCLHMAAELESRWFVKVLILLKADTNIANHYGVRPMDLDIVKDVANQEHHAEFSDHIFDFISTNVEFLDKTIAIAGDIVKKEDSMPTIPSIETLPRFTMEMNQPSLKILESIQELLVDTNREHTSTLHQKRNNVKELYLALHDVVITTANNRFMAKSISSKLVDLDKMKLQIANLTDKLLCMSELLETKDAAINSSELQEEENSEGDSSYIIRPLYERFARKEPADDLMSDSSFIESLPPPNLLRARIEAYEKVNELLEGDIQALKDCSELTMKFKKVVSMCTNVDVDAVDELLDGLLEAVNEQHQ